MVSQIMKLSINIEFRSVTLAHAHPPIVLIRLSVPAAATTLLAVDPQQPDLLQQALGVLPVVPAIVQQPRAIHLALTQPPRPLAVLGEEHQRLHHVGVAHAVRVEPLYVPFVVGVSGLVVPALPVKVSNLGQGDALTVTLALGVLVALQRGVLHVELLALVALAHRAPEPRVPWPELGGLFSFGEREKRVSLEERSGSK